MDAAQAETRIRSVREHDELRPCRDRGLERRQPRGEERRSATDGDGAVVSARDRAAEPGEMLRRRRDATALESGDERGGEQADERGVAAERARAEGAPRGG